MDKNKDNLYEKFQNLKDKKIFIYGTGVIARRIIDNLSNFNFVGIIDGVHYFGEIEGIPIKMWDEVYEGDADVVIIASRPVNYEIIYERIIDRCIAYDMKIYGANGKNLIPYYGIRFMSMEKNKYFEKNENELIEKIKRYDAVSFDLFDTLVMRKNLEPTDLFDIVGQRIQRKGIVIPNFKKYRREAELLSNGGNIYEIYKVFQKILNLTKEKAIMILEEEIECEKECIIPRKKMVDIMAEAHNMGKKVSIITNMYIPGNILSKILEEKGILEYDHIFVSCEFGVSKGNGLFEKYFESIKAKKYLHIGDDESEDVLAAQNYGLDAYGIKSAYEMLKISNYRRTLIDIHTSNEKGLMGLVISELFNDPFALFGTNGFVRMTDLKIFCKVFVAPIAIFYILKLIENVHNIDECDGILFGARDGYLFKKIYDRLRMEGILNVPEIPSWYFMTSRKLCLKSGMKSKKDIMFLKEYISDNKIEEVLTQILEIQNILPYDQKRYANIDDYYLENMGEILKKSAETRKRYSKYINANKININGKYLFCDLISHGTSQYGLNQIFKNPIYGFYLCRNPGNYKLNVYSCYQYNEEDTTFIEKENINFLESILTSADPSVKDMNEDGSPVFAAEKRSLQELISLQYMQEAIEEFVFEYINTMYIEDEAITGELPKLLLKLPKETLLDGECKVIKSRELFEDLHDKYLGIFDEVTS